MTSGLQDTITLKLILGFQAKRNIKSLSHSLMLHTFIHLPCGQAATDLQVSTKRDIVVSVAWLSVTILNEILFKSGLWIVIWVGSVNPEILIVYKKEIKENHSLPINPNYDNRLNYMVKDSCIYLG